MEKTNIIEKTHCNYSLTVAEISMPTLKLCLTKKCVLLQLMEVGIVIEGELLLLAHSLVVGSSAGSLRCILE